VLYHICLPLSLFLANLIGEYFSIAMMPKIDPRNALGAIFHTPVDKVLGERTTKAHLGNANYCLNFLLGIIICASDGKKGGTKCTQWRLS
jgi:hypothetical protein